MLCALCESLLHFATAGMWPKGRAHSCARHIDGPVFYARADPRRAASILAMSIFRISIIASNARFAAALSLSVVASIKTRGVICQDKPHLSLHHPHALSAPP